MGPIQIRPDGCRDQLFWRTADGPLSEAIWIKSNDKEDPVNRERTAWSDHRKWEAKMRC